MEGNRESEEEEEATDSDDTEEVFIKLCIRVSYFIFKIIITK